MRSMARPAEFWHPQNWWDGHKTFVSPGSFVGILYGKMYEYGHIDLPQRIIEWGGKRWGNPELFAGNKP